MVEDMTRYHPDVKRNVLFSIRKRKLSEIIKTLGETADTNKIPCITIVYWLGEHYGYPPELKVSLDSLMKFYGYTKIIGKPPGCPW